jgi:hypothetical protein
LVFVEVHGECAFVIAAQRYFPNAGIPRYF